MIKTTQKQNAFRLFALAGFVYGLSACGHHHTKENCCPDRGEQFVNEWEVVKIYRHDNDEPPVNLGGSFKIERFQDSSTFRLVPDAGFSDRNDEWKTLDLQYKPGSAANEPIALIAQVCTAKQICRGTKPRATVRQEENRYDKRPNNAEEAIVQADVQFDFTNLRGRQLESLRGAQKLAGKYNITIFHIRGIDSKSIDLLIFYCQDEECKNTGMVRGVKR